MFENRKSSEEVINEKKHAKPSILIGNGFNSAISSFLKKEFPDYNSIFKKIIENEKNELLRDFFSNLYDKHYTNIEKIIALFDEVEHLNKNDTDSKIINDLVNSIMIAFLDILIEHHPSYSEIFPEIDKSHIFENIGSFEKIYTLNFDIILYWIIMRDNNLTKNFYDGFSHKISDSNFNCFNNESNRKLLFLHGAFHIFLTESSAIKFKQSDKSSLFNFIRKNLKNLISGKSKSIKFMNSSIVIAEKSNNKLKKIKNHLYLHSGIEHLKKEKDNIVVYGCDPFAKVDSHIWDAISKSQVKKIYFGIHDECLNTDLYQSDLNNSKWAEKEIYFFNSKNITICDDKFLDQISDTAILKGKH